MKVSLLWLLPLLMGLLSAVRPAMVVHHPVSPEELVQQQIDAWNAHDAGSFAAPHADSTRLYLFPDKLQKAFTSRAEVQAYYAPLFEKHPAIRCEVKGKIVAGNTVVLHQLITGSSDGRKWQTIATYKIENGKIARVYFDRQPL